MSTSAEDFFGSGAKSASYRGAAPITWHGVVTRVGEPVQATEYNSQDPSKPGKPKFYPGSNDPIMQLPITIQTDVRDPASPDDDGQRTIYVGGDKRRALKEAMRAAGVRGPKVGDWLAMTFVGTDPQSKNPDNPKKLYKADYAVNPNAGAAGFFSEPTPQAAPQPTFQPPAPVAAPSWGQQVAQAGPPPAFAGQVVPPAAAPAAAASPFAPIAGDTATNAPWPPAQAQSAAAAQPVTVGAPDQGQPLAPQRPWGNVPA